MGGEGSYLVVNDLALHSTSLRGDGNPFVHQVLPAIQHLPARPYHHELWEGKSKESLGLLHGR